MSLYVDEKVAYLSTMDLFQDLNQDDLMLMERQLTMASCQRGKIFYMPDDTGQVLFLLKRGRVQLYRISPGGKKLVVATLGPGAIFGEMALVGQQMHRTFAESVDDCLICVMSRADVERLVREKPKVALRFLESMGERIAQMERRLEELAFKSIPARLAGLLLRLADDQGSGTEVDGYTHQDLGEMLGTYRETTTQVLNDFKADGLIELGRKRIRLLDTRGLAAVAEA
ncbi:MAG: Crp/Fnr family transcriptional regulator [Anaerolineales bacterium]|nr:Crp/Fnr family transcriptional regulator [Anaerolineales bacterium]MCB0027578.1 Crp/Fnr family transcriptional regulator [Anaerolineales bacterium]